MKNATSVSNNTDNTLNTILLNNYRIYLVYLKNTSNILNQISRNWTQQNKNDAAFFSEIMEITSNFMKFNKTENSF
jgi:hypothetical protein